jgi:predicted 3-demethylubiquinone-9 3-methyltransferase (glyoxalase superfamily)
MNNIYPCLWFNQNAQEAAEFYVSIFPNSKIISTSYYGPNMHLPEGTVLTVSIELNGCTVMLLNGGPLFKFSEAISLVVPCETQAEIDGLWSALTADGGEESQCGWLKDKYGLSWQIAPAIMDEWLNAQDQSRTNRVMQALMPMKKLDMAVLEAAFNSTA